MRSDGVLTSVDIEVEHQRLAKQAFDEAGIASQRVRFIPGAALEVLPRLTDGHYDLVFCDGDKQEYPQYLEQALRLLRPGGVVAFDNSLWHDRVADASVRDADTLAIRETLATVAEHEDLTQVLCPSATASSSPRRTDGATSALLRATCRNPEAQLHTSLGFEDATVGLDHLARGHVGVVAGHQRRIDAEACGDG